VAGAQDQGENVLWLAKCVDAVPATSASWEVHWMFETDDENTFDLSIDEKDMVFRDSVMGEIRGHHWDSSRRSCFVPTEILLSFKSELPQYRTQSRQAVNLHEPSTPAPRKAQLTTQQICERLKLSDSIAQEVNNHVLLLFEVDDGYSSPYTT
jgi:hypothetical protein